MSELTPEKKRLLDTEGHILALGGPGSGKTYIALLKADCEIRAGKLLRGQRILFLSFARATIARVAQQAGKLISGSERNAFDINTYHGFAWKLLQSHGYLLNASQRIRLLPPPEAASRLAEIDVEARPAEKHRLFDEEGFLHFDLFAAVCGDLLYRSESLARIVCDSYPVIILDEFQDTNADEWQMIQALGKRSRLIALADAEQRIYEFRGADPKRIGEFINVYQPMQFDFGSENNRSNGTDIAIFGNDLLTEANKAKNYKDVVLTRYGFYQGRSAHYALKGTLIQSIKRQLKSGKESWSVAVLVPTKRLMLQVSDYLTAEQDNLPILNHDVALDTEAPALAAILIAGILEGGTTSAEIAQRLILDLCMYIRGRKGNSPPNQGDLGLTGALGGYLKSGTVRGKKREQIVRESTQVAEKMLSLQLLGDPWEDWRAVRRLLTDSGSDVLQQVTEDAKYLRLLHKGAALRSRLGELWRTTGSYRGAASAVRDALLQEHFSASIKEWRGVHVMTIHKSKGKEFDEVIIYEGSHQGRIARANANDRELAQARLILRVGVTRAMQRATILTPGSDPCRFL